jgi:archaellum biogenesis ATPase FlaH
MNWKKNLRGSRREMNLGKELVSSVIYSGTMESLINAGYTRQWLTSPASEAVLSGQDKQVYTWLLDYYSKHRTVPKMTVFRGQYPEQSYKLNEDYVPLTELVSLVSGKVTSYQVADIIGKVIDLHHAGRIDDAVSFLKSSSSRLGSERYEGPSGYDIASPNFDLEALLNTELAPGVPLGIDPVDKEFWGFQPGQMITLMGRQKSCKSWMTLNSAYSAWRAGYSVLFFSVEMGEKLLLERLLCLGAHVSPSRMRRGILVNSEKNKVRDFHAEIKDGADSGRFVISRKKTLITLDDIASEVDTYKPHVVYIDGFSFMLDRKTNRMTDDWQANENVAAEMKAYSMEKDIVSFINTQVQEKQYSAAKGVEAKNIQGGTGLLKASDLIIGQDKEGTLVTLSCQMSRFEEFDDVHVDIDFDTMTFSIVSEMENLKDWGM